MFGSDSNLVLGLIKENTFCSDSLIMPIRASKRPEKLDQLLIGLSILGSVVCLFLLMNDGWLFNSKNNGNREKIGAMINTKLDVRRRSADDFIWLPIEKSLPVFEGDSLFTGAKSSAMVKLDSGLTLQIDPDSLVVLSKELNSDGTKLDLKFGQLRGTIDEKKSGTVNLSINNKKLALSGKAVDFGLEKVTESETKLRVLKGTAQLQDLVASKQIELNQSQQVKLSSDKSADVEELGAVSAPDFVNRQRWAGPRTLWLPKKQPLIFAWEAEGQIEFFEFLLSDKSDMSHLLVKERLKSSSYSWEPPTDSGKVFWQVRAVNRSKKQNIESDVNPWSYIVLTPPAWIDTENPMNLTKMELWGLEEVEPIVRKIKWTLPLKSSQSRLEWSRQADFGEKESLAFMDHEWKIPKWELGQYYIRVRSEAMGRPPSLWSPTLVVNISDKDPDGLLAPDVLLTDLETEEMKGAPRIEWKPQAKAARYVIEMSETPDFAKTVELSQQEAAQWRGQPRAKGSYYLRVVPLTDKGRRGPVSKTIKWTTRVVGPKWKLAKLVLPVQIPRDKSNRLMAFPETRIEWQDLSQEKPLAYLIEQDQQPDFSSKTNLKVTSTDLILKDLKVGDYYFRVRAFYGEGAFSLNSDVLKVKVSEQNPDGLPEPELLTKKLETPLGLDDLAVAKLKWEKMPEADQFIVQMSEDAAFSKLLNENKLAQHQADLSIQTRGNYFLRVAGISKKGNLGPWSAVVPWKVYLGPPILEPMANITVEVESSNSPVPPTPLKMVWKAHKSLKNYRLQLAEDSEFTKILLNQKLNANEFIYNLPKGGRFRVRIQGVTEEGVELTPFSKVEEMMFSLKHPLISPVLLFPKNKVSYILAKMKTSELWLEWENRDRLSTSYQIEFSKDREFTEVKYTRKSNQPRLLLDHKTIKGKLYWRVKAINEEQQLFSPWSEPWSLSVVDILSED